MAEAEAARGKVHNFIVAGIEIDSLRVDAFGKDEETEMENITVTDNQVLGAVNIAECLKGFKYAVKAPKELKYNEVGEEIDLEGGFAGILDGFKERFENVYPEESPYTYWGHPHDFLARGIIQECITLYRDGQFNNAQWINGPYLKLFNAGNLLFTSVLPHATGMSMCMINYNKKNRWTPNRGFYTSMQTRSEYYPLNFKANAEDGWKPEFYNSTFGGFAINWPYKVQAKKYDEAGEVIGTEPKMCGDWILPQLLWHVENGEQLTQYPVMTTNITQEHKPEKFEVTKKKLLQTKFDFAGNVNYKLTIIKIGKELVDGHKDIYVMGESNKEIICAGKFREGIMIINFATKEHPPNQGRRPQLNKANAYRVQQFFAGLIEKGFLTTFAGDDAIAQCYKD